MQRSKPTQIVEETTPTLCAGGSDDTQHFLQRRKASSRKRRKRSSSPVPSLSQIVANDCCCRRTCRSSLLAGERVHRFWWTLAVVDAEEGQFGYLIIRNSCKILKIARKSDLKLLSYISEEEGILKKDEEEKKESVSMRSSGCLQEVSIADCRGLQQYLPVHVEEAFH
ncbi:hypothetical protein RHMOL_Rhmol02G0167700 [Rhododendron molle]|uniref:Uncharacterized protein n=1 Tax=Rhododendron molle TaxID=49168 RepID=A0ACC0PSQ1_RHOML|nr:hypothetical protein RHMOL_Rhmol02G0167700 [Rhododendron molle]